MKTKKINPKRQELIALSKAVRPMVKIGQFDSVNEAILFMYEEQTGESNWKHFKGWIEEGFKVRKGEKGFAVWGRPRKMKKSGEQDNTVEVSEEKKMEFFPMAYLFNESQVEAI